jgi:hypothetical protein
LLSHTGPGTHYCFGGRVPNSAPETALASRKKARDKRGMSGHGHDDADTAHDGHHEPETSSDDFPADEPRSPGWLPLLGGALFLAGIAAFLAFGTDSASDTPAAAVAAFTAAPALVPAAPAPRPGLRMPPGMQLPAGHPQ